MRTQFTLISWLMVAIIGCGSEVPGTSQSKLQPAIQPASQQAAEQPKPVEVAKADKVEAAAATSAVPALEEPTADGHNWNSMRRRKTNHRGSLRFALRRPDA